MKSEQQKADLAEQKALRAARIAERNATILRLHAEGRKTNEIAPRVQMDIRSVAKVIRDNYPSVDVAAEMRHR